MNNINNSRSRLVSTVTNTTDFDQCSKFIDKVTEGRFYKIKERQINKFNILISKSNNIRSSQDNQIQTSTVGNSNDIKNNSQLQVETNSKWVINLSKTRLSIGQTSVLSKGPNFAIAPRHIPNIDYITAVELVCHKPKEEDAGELRADINSLLRRAKVSRSSFTKQESIGLNQLKKDKDRVVLTADKGVAMVVMDKEDYIKKAESLLAQPAYKTIDRDPTIQIKAKLINKLRNVKKDTNMDKGMYKTMYSTGYTPPKFYGLPKIHKIGTPLRSIISSRGSVTYGVAKYLPGY